MRSIGRERNSGLSDDLRVLRRDEFRMWNRLYDNMHAVLEEDHSPNWKLNASYMGVLMRIAQLEGNVNEVARLREILDGIRMQEPIEREGSPRQQVGRGFGVGIGGLIRGVANDGGGVMGLFQSRGGY